jgi:hypothetical protein
MEYLRVTFNGTRATRTVLIDGEPNGQTEDVLRLGAGTYTVKLDGAADYTPKWRRPTLQDTTRDNPCEVSFDKA